MKKIYFFFLFSSFVFTFHSSSGQSGTWTWLSGDSAANSLGVYGTQGVPSISNYPPGLYEPSEWKDKQGNFWIYGGYTPETYSDLWKYNPVTNEWTWVKGNDLTNQSPVYGTQGVPNAANTPGQRSYAAASWIDTSGALWLFGGVNNSGFHNDLWKYDIASNQWTWIKGSGIGNASGIHGIEGIANIANTPGARGETASAWTDSLNNLWLFGGLGYDDSGQYGYLNDLCKYNISTNEWTWIKGSAFINAAANYGTKGVAVGNNDPGARISYTKWKDNLGNFWLMGGMNDNYNCFNDVWKFDLSINEWTWVSGANVADDTGNYNATCIFDNVDVPYSRMEQRSAVTDNCGRFWLFGGEDFDLSYVFNDLWVFDPQQLKWNWVNGTNIPNQLGSYGSLNVTSPGTIPPSRFGGVAWWGNDNKFYLFGGSRFYCYSNLWVFNPDTTCVAVCSLSPTAAFQASETIFCANDCISFTNLSTNSTSWQWSFEGGLPATSTDENPQNICYETGGIYNVTLTASNAAGSSTATINNYITIYPAPPTPSITQSHDTLYCSTNPSYTSYQWYSDTSIIKGATDTLFVTTLSGNYNVRVTNSYGCSIAVGINIVGIKEFTMKSLQFTLSPNPVTDELLINGNLKSETERLTIYNVLGETIYSEIVNHKEEAINCKSFPAGIYFVQMAGESGKWVGRFVKE